MAQARVLVIQDISASCRISMNVAAPVLSVLNNEVNVLPTALLSTHTTSGFTDYTYLDLTDESQKILQHWDELGIRFDGILVGYIGSVQQIKRIESIVERFLKTDGHFILDPAMGDGGELYEGFDGEYLKEMRKLSAMASVILPNQTEAAYLMDESGQYNFNKGIEPLVKKVAQLNQKTIILTGVMLKNEKIGAMSYNDENGESETYYAPYYEGHFEGSGDLFSSVITGLILQGKTIHEAIKIAVEYVSKCIKRTSLLSEDKRRYGIQFETDLPYLIQQLLA